ncbi:hypothetical protein QEH59_16185 [Coraliomargarita sp. SDUM461004]|uniref:Glycoside hydrolase family 42 N-terminal domain-containing protein n=1 Tax=Thalassobacterium sedimentorum TaxID=3041258 RepID=A0ABU1AME7_9BACT|nr:hypothetical protein [Coraliomargarita sp. SDUM461004]MDQ8195975.1 hypothetical protein [Coraliomargarita sp. SDUM461004]
MTSYCVACSSELVTEHEQVIRGGEALAFVTDESFQTPPNEYRIMQYQLTPDTLEKYPKYGIGGVMAFFYGILYPESGKASSSLVEAGPEVIGQLVDAAKAIDYQVWLADDWGYPSGMAGGRVVAEDPNYEVKSLTMLTVEGTGRELIDRTLPEDLYDIVSATLYPVRNGNVDLGAGESVQFSGRTIRSQGIGGEWQLRIFARYVRDKNTQAQSTMKQFGHAGRYPDLMNRQAVGRFIANMHEPILAQIKDPASQVEGFYCNEPNLMQTHWTRAHDAPYACVPWSEGLPQQFSQMHGYDITSTLPYLFEGTGDAARRARLHYRQAVAELLTDSFSRQIREWCNERGIKSSGHFLLNDYLSMHVQGYGDLMKFVSEFDVPALDIPIPNPAEFQDFAYQQSRFFSSVSSWKKRDSTIMLLDPIIGGYGRTRLSPDLPLLLNAINMACFHGVNVFTSYMPLEAKETKDAQGRTSRGKGYTIEDYNFLNEYTGRMTQVLRGAQREAGVGLYYPISMFQSDLLASTTHWPSIRDQHKDRQHAWDRTERALLDGDVEYMIVHPEAVAEADIIDGEIRIGYGSYHTLVMPQLDFIPLSVSQQLAAFEKQGGTVIWVDQVPRAAEHDVNDEAVISRLIGAKMTPHEELAAAIGRSCSADYDLSFSPGSDQLTVGRFYKEDQQVYLIVNRTEQMLSVQVDGHRDGAATMGHVLDPSTGTIRQLRLPVTLELQATRSLLLIPDRGYLGQQITTH